MKAPISTKKIIAPKEIPSFFGKEITGLSKYKAIPQANPKAKL